DEFIMNAKTKIEAYLKDPNNKDRFTDYVGNDNRASTYDKDFANPEAARKYLNQMQARLYLHPDLFEPGRMGINTYYSLPTTPQMVEKYNNKVNDFSQHLCALILRAKKEERLRASP